MEHNVTPEWIAEQRGICEAATQGPWATAIITNAEYYKNAVACSRAPGRTIAVEVRSSYDSAFIAAARTALPAAIDALEAAYAEIERLTHDYAASATRMIDEKDRLTDELSAETRRADAAVYDLEKLAKDCDKEGSEVMCPYCRNYTWDTVESCKKYNYDDEGNIVGECDFEWRGPCAENSDAPIGAESGETK